MWIMYFCFLLSLSLSLSLSVLIVLLNKKKPTCDRWFPKEENNKKKSYAKLLVLQIFSVSIWN